MELALAFIFAVVFAMAYNFAFPKFSTWANARPQFAKYANGFAGQTVVTAVAVFVLLYAVGLVFSMAGERTRIGSVSVS